MNARPRAVVLMTPGQDRNDLARLLGSWGLEVVVCATPGEYLDAAPATGPACLILDDDLPGRPGLEFQRTLNRLDDLTPMIVFSSQATPDTAVAYLQQGAVTLLSKPYADDAVKAAVEAAIRHDIRWSGVRQRMQTLAGCEKLLTDRERVVLDEIVQGAPNKSIARNLGVSLRTAESIRATVFRKYEVDTAAELAARRTELKVLCELASMCRCVPLRPPTAAADALMALAG